MTSRFNLNQFSRHLELLGIQFQRCSSFAKTALSSELHSTWWTLLSNDHRRNTLFRILTIISWQWTTEDASSVIQLFLESNLLRSLWLPFEKHLESNNNNNKQRALIYDEMNRVMALLHSLDYKALGLADYGRPGDYNRRQVGPNSLLWIEWTRLSLHSCHFLFSIIDRKMERSIRSFKDESNREHGESD